MAVRSPNDFRFSLFRGIPRDYLLRRKIFRNVLNIILLLLLSILAAGIIVYTSNPSSFQSQ